MRVKDPAKTTLIFQATLKLVAQTGIDGLKMADIAREAGIATGTLYTYFKDKETLLIHLYEIAKAHCLHYLPQAEKEEVPFRIQFKNAFTSAQQYWVRFYAEALFMDHFYQSSFITVSLKAQPLPLDEYFTRLLKLARKQFLVKDVDSDLLLCAITGLIRQAATLCSRQERKLNKPLLDQLLILCWDAIKA